MELSASHLPSHLLHPSARHAGDGVECLPSKKTIAEWQSYWGDFSFSRHIISTKMGHAFFKIKVRSGTKILYEIKYIYILQKLKKIIKFSNNI